MTACRGGSVQIYDQSASPSGRPETSALWNWNAFNERNMFEVPEFRPHMMLHNFYEGYAASKDGAVSQRTLDDAQERLRGLLEDCDNLRCVQWLVDMDSSWGGLAHEMLTYITEECPSTVVVTIGNDWAYPLPDQGLDYMFAVDGATQDKAKQAARRQINMASSLASLSELSSVMIPVSLMTAAALQPYALDVSEGCLPQSNVAAAAIEVAMSAYKETSYYVLAEGLVPSMKTLELAVAMPFTNDVRALLKPLQDASDGSYKDFLSQRSFLPSEDPKQKARRLAEDARYERESRWGVYRAHHRVLHCRGMFAEHSPPSSMLLDRVNHDRAVVRWTPDVVLLPPSSFLAQAQDFSMDAVSELAQSTNVGLHLDTVGQQLQHVDRRVLHEFTRAGMASDAVGELSAALRGASEAYEP
ncbi:TPA: hypothetical protein N0F65_000209 [Lagenidium giganteum]|uniref:DML1/Misato tubulin domain-containing protein n=1 Tax=Lagenidium giganteum TaxID=4803 RepID=A0AAV2YDY0_9STRA|nr:TPA: hypothetical protein N0F65_000209 [Lagenidium giganteum]